MSNELVTPEYVMDLQGPTEGYLCPLSANTYGIAFLEFSIKDAESQEILYHVRRDPSKEGSLPPSIDPNSTRCVYYTFRPAFLDKTNIATSLTFSVGDQPLTDFQMIERHYCGATLVKSYEFKFNFCAPNSVNTWETEYEVPALEPTLKQRILEGNFDMNTSDTFFFVGGKLIMHNKACYQYSETLPQGGGLNLSIPPKPTIVPK